MKPFPRLVGWLKPYRLRIAAALLLMGVYSGLTVLVVYLTKPVLDEGLFAKPMTPDEGRLMLEYVAKLAGLALIATAVKGVAKYGADYLVGWVGQKVIFDLRMSLFSRLQTLSLRYFHERRTGELISRVIADVGAMQVMLTQLFGPAITSILTVLALSGYILFLNWKLALISLLVFPVAVLPVRKFGQRLKRQSREVQELTGDLSAHLEETLSQMKLVMAYQGEEREVARWRRKLQQYLAAALTAIRVQARSTPVMETIGAVGFVGLILVSGYQILISRSMSGGGLASFLVGVLSLYPHIKHLSGLWNSISTGMGAAERVFPVLDEEPAVRDAGDAVALPAFSGSIRYAGVAFSFRAGTRVLDAIDLEVARGKRVAFVGPSGAGKTTLMDLLMRFHDPDSGAITVDGVDIRKATLGSLRSRIALVTQEVLLFNATARDNLLYARPGATEGEMVAAARAAGAHGFISALPNGYDTVIGERGVKLSGGERQRLSIARAFLKDSPILVLDEATASLDAASEALIQEALDKLMANRTVLVIAHRLATARRADTIIVLDGGRIVERGSHDELYAAGKLYRKLCDLQFSEPAQQELRPGSGGPGGAVPEPGTAPAN
jgi:subfamily B ATP-binding cassette protein MsbA